MSVLGRFAAPCAVSSAQESCGNWSKLLSSSSVLLLPRAPVLEQRHEGEGGVSCKYRAAFGTEFCQCDEKSFHTCNCLCRLL